MCTPSRSDESTESESEDDMSDSYCTSDEEEQEDPKDYHKGANNMKISQYHPIHCGLPLGVCH